MYDDSNNMHVQCLILCYFGIFWQNWNNHRIRPSRNAEVPSGKPNILYVLPELTALEITCFL